MAVGSGQWRNWAPAARSRLELGEGCGGGGAGQDSPNPLPEWLFQEPLERRPRSWNGLEGVASPCLAMNLLRRQCEHHPSHVYSRKDFPLKSTAQADCNLAPPSKSHGKTRRGRCTGSLRRARAGPLLLSSARRAGPRKPFLFRSRGGLWDSFGHAPCVSAAATEAERAAGGETAFSLLPARGR